MQIGQSSVQLASTHHAIEKHEFHESLTVWDRSGKETRGHEGSRPGGLEEFARDFTAASAKVELSPAARRAAPQRKDAPPIGEEDRVLADLNIRILKQLIERMTGRKIRFVEPAAAGGDQEADPATADPAQGSPGASNEGRVGWGVQYDYSETRYEAEQTTFSAEGAVLTSDGRSIDFTVDLTMSREFLSTTQLTFRAGDALKDPLVINFGGTAAQLSETTFSFDIDVDGTADQIHFLAPGSGFLAMDRNSDGTVNDGGELFGALSGDGFADLATYDKDGNGWIDEADAVYNRLRIWSRSASGEEQLLALGQAGVGALYLGHVTTPFSVKDSDNSLQAQVRESGVFLHEDGRAGTLQQLDLVV